MQLTLPKIIWNRTEEPPLDRAGKIHQQVRALRKNPEALDDLPMELFLRIVGIFFTLSEERRANVKYAGTANKFLDLREFIDQQIASDDGKNFAKYEMADYVHNLHLLLIEIVNLDYLEANIHNIREEYRNHVGDITYRIYTLSKSFLFLEKYRDKAPDDAEFIQIKGHYEEKLRIDYGNIINEIRKARLYEVHIEGTRRYLMKKALKSWLLLCIVPFVIIVGYDRVPASFINYSDLAGLALFSIAAIAGATGSLVSVVLRIQGVRDNTQLAQNIFAFKYSQTTVQVAPLTGMVFGILLSYVICGGLIGGTMFPVIDLQAKPGGSVGYNSILDSIENLAKLLVWSFIAGFSERLVPDMVDRLADKAKKADEKSGG